MLSNLRREFNEAELELKEYVIDTLKITKRKLSRMRDSINLESKGSALTDRGKIARIRCTRGAFLWLPIKYDNDLVHGSWYFVYGSFLSTLIPMIPLIDIYTRFFYTPEDTQLGAFANSSTWIFLIISGIFSTVGSYVFIRAFKDPPVEPLFPDLHHFCTDELFASWILLVATIPSIPYCIVFLAYSPNNLTYVAALVSSILFVIGSAFFTYTCYPSVSELYHTNVNYILPKVQQVFGTNSWICKHCKTDWLFSCWIMFYSTLLWLFGSYVELFNSENDRQLFVYLTSFVDALLFLVGSAYYVSGSYTTEHANEEFDQYAKEIDDDGTTIAYFANLGKIKRKIKTIDTVINVIHDNSYNNDNSVGFDNTHTNNTRNDDNINSDYDDINI